MATARLRATWDQTAVVLVRLTQFLNLHLDKDHQLPQTPADYHPYPRPAVPNNAPLAETLPITALKAIWVDRRPRHT